MPSIKDLKSHPKPNKMFKKKEYRPWDENKTNNSIEEITIEKKAQTLVSTEPKTKKEPKEGTPINNDLEKIWRGLYGAKKTIFEIILRNIEENHENYIVTNAITADLLSSSSSLPPNTIKATIQQLKYNLLIENYETKPGKGGVARYKISKEIYKYFGNKFSSSK